MSTKLKTRPTGDLNAVFIPVIFANGEDDDLPGIVAALEGRDVLYNESVVRPADPLLIYKRRLRWKADEARFREREDVFEVCDGGEVTRSVPIRRTGHVTIAGCHIIVGR